MKNFLIILCVLVISLIILKDLVIKSVATIATSQAVGAPVHMDSFSINIFSSTIHITGLKIYNPSGFPKGTLVSCPKINVIFDRASLFTKKYHFLLVDIELKEMLLTKNKEGKLNVDSLRIVKQSKSAPKTPIQIDLLNLSIGKIVYTDYTVGPKPSVRVSEINKQRSYKSIPTMEQLALLVFAEPMKAALIKNAEIYGTAMLTGVAVLPVAFAATFIGKDDVQQSLNTPMEQVYKISLEVIKGMGRVTSDDAFNQMIKANINGSAVALKLRKITDNKTEITISARKYMFPEIDVAGGVLYQILDKL